MEMHLIKEKFLKEQMSSWNISEDYILYRDYRNVSLHQLSGPCEILPMII